MGNATSWITQTFCPEEQIVWVAAKSGDVAAIQQALTRLTPANRHYLEWKDPVFGYTPLANACAEGHVQCVYALLSAGVDVNVRDTKGYTPLHLATLKGKNEIVRLLVEHASVDLHARTPTKRQTALDIARYEYSNAYEGAHQLVQCIEVIEKKLCVYSGWLYQRADNLLSLASGMSALHSWKRRYCMVLRTADALVVEIDLFTMKPGEKRPPCPSVELVYKLSDGLQQSTDPTWFNRKEHRFSMNGYTKSGINRVSAPQTFDFAAISREDLAQWKTFFANLRMGVEPSRASAVGGAAPSVGIPAAAMLDEQRDMERALQLSLEEARRHSARVGSPSMPVAMPPPAAPAAPASAPPWSDLPPGSPEPMLAPDGVEIVQMLEQASPAPRRSSASTSSARADDAEEKRERGECVICFDGPQAAVCVPCGHNAICMDCAGELLSSTRQCPVCRVQIREVIKLFRV